MTETGATDLRRWLIVGAGSFGTAFAHVMQGRNVELTLAARTPEHAAQMRATGCNERYFPGLSLSTELTITTITEAADSDWDVVVFAVPASAFGENVERFAHRGRLFVNLSKGLDEASGGRLSEVAARYIDLARYAVITGPNIAHEMMHDLPSAAVVAGTNLETLRAVQFAVHGAGFRVYANEDLIGAELAGALKNVVALAAGIAESAGFGNNGVAGVMTRGLCEIARLGTELGANMETFLGLAGMGDLVTTCASPYGRNKRAGVLLGKGMSPVEACAEIGQVVEGLRTAPIVRRMAAEAGVQMSICTAVADMAEFGTPLPELVRGLLARKPSFEFEPGDTTLA